MPKRIRSQIPMDRLQRLTIQWTTIHGKRVNRLKCVCFENVLKLPAQRTLIELTKKVLK